VIYFVTAIHTDSGKTLVSAILTQALGAGYWKPVQAGFPTDTEIVKSLVTNPECRFFTENYRLQMPASPHLAAKAEGVEIQLRNIRLLGFKEHLVIEGAGGVLVPLNDSEFVIDIATRFQAEIILVSDTYLGSINHTLLTYRELERRNLKIRGIIFNRVSDGATEDIILSHTGLPCLLRIKQETEVTPALVATYAEELKKNLIRF
jgi:dethiobiotin synthetase